jgi:hypothetical protein
MRKTIVIAARINCAIEVVAEPNEYGEVQILAVNRIQSLPTPTDIYESMLADELEDLDTAYNEAD